MMRARREMMMARERREVMMVRKMKMIMTTVRQIVSASCCGFCLSRILLYFPVCVRVSVTGVTSQFFTFITCPRLY